MKFLALLFVLSVASSGVAQENESETPAPPEKTNSYDLFPNSSLAIGTDALNQQERYFYFSMAQISGELFDKMGPSEQESRARSSLTTLGAYFSPVPAKVRVGLTYNQNEGHAKAKVYDTTDEANPKESYRFQIKQKEVGPRLHVAVQTTERIRLALEFSSSTVTHQTRAVVGTNSGSTEESQAYGNYRVSSMIALPKGYELGFDFTPTIRIDDDISINEPGETSAVIRRSLRNSIVQGQLTHTRHSAIQSDLGDTLSVSLGGERKLLEEVGVGGWIKYEPASYGKTKNISSGTIPTLSLGIMGKFKLDKNVYFTGEVLRAKAAEVSKKLSGVEFTANSVVTGGIITLSYTGI